MDEAEARKRIVEEAQSWIGTPYHAGADVKGAGVDCGMLLVRVFVDSGLVPSFDPRPYPAQWHLHQKAERYLGWVRQFAREIEKSAILPGDIVMFKFGKCFAHGAIVIEWPIVIHALGPHKVVPDDVERRSALSRLDQLFFSIWGTSVP